MFLAMPILSPLKKIAGTLKLDLAQYRELEAFAQFASELDDITRKQLEHGQYAVEILKQIRFAPLTVAEIAISLLLVEQKLIYDIPLNKVMEFEKQMRNYFNKNYKNILDEINQQPVYTDEIGQKLRQIILEFKREFLQII